MTTFAAYEYILFDLPNLACGSLRLPFLLTLYHQLSSDILQETNQNSSLLSGHIHHGSPLVWLNTSAKLPSQSAGFGGRKEGQRVFKHNKKYLRGREAKRKTRPLMIFHPFIDVFQ